MGEGGERVKMEREVGSGGRRREDSKIGCVCGWGGRW